MLRNIAGKQWAKKIGSLTAAAGGKIIRNCQKKSTKKERRNTNKKS
jgi:hypothetical protein